MLALRFSRGRGGEAVVLGLPTGAPRRRGVLGALCGQGQFGALGLGFRPAAGGQGEGDERRNGGYMNGSGSCGVCIHLGWLLYNFTLKPSAKERRNASQAGRIPITNAARVTAPTVYISSRPGPVPRRLMP